MKKPKVGSKSVTPVSPALSGLEKAAARAEADLKAAKKAARLAKARFRLARKKVKQVRKAAKAARAALATGLKHQAKSKPPRPVAPKPAAAKQGSASGREPSKS